MRKKATDHSEKENKMEYAQEDICIVVQTNKCLQFQTTHISQILEKLLKLDTYLLTKGTTFQ